MPDRPMACPGTETNVHLVSDITTAKAILEDTSTFRIAAMPEYVPGMSSSYFLAGDMSNPERAACCHAEMAAYLAPNRAPEIYRVLQTEAGAAAAELPVDQPFDIAQDCLHPYGYRVASVLSGLPLEEIRILAGAMNAAADAGREHGPSTKSTLLTWAWNRLHAAIASGAAQTDPGLPAFTMRRRKVTTREIALLTMPLIEMAAYQRNTAIARIALDEIRRSGRDLGRAVVAGGIRDLLWEAAAAIEGLYVTRIANADIMLANTHVSSGDRIVIDVTTANRAAGDPENGQKKNTEHIAFGWGRHACIAREFSLHINQAILYALSARGRLRPSPGQPGGLWEIKPDLG